MPIKSLEWTSNWIWRSDQTLYFIPSIFWILIKFILFFHVGYHYNSVRVIPILGKQMHPVESLSHILHETFTRRSEVKNTLNECLFCKSLNIRFQDLLSEERYISNYLLCLPCKTRTKSYPSSLFVLYSCSYRIYNLNYKNYLQTELKKWPELFLILSPDNTILLDIKVDVSDKVAGFFSLFLIDIL